VLYKRGLIRSKLYAVDGSGIGPEMRVVGLLCWQKDGPLWVNWRLRTGNASEKGQEGEVVLAMVDEIRQIAGEEVMAWLLMDALYADGFILANLKYARQIDVMVRLPEDRRMDEQLMGCYACCRRAGKPIWTCAICLGINKLGRCGWPRWTT
jgi:hypothetical protein